MTRTLVGTSPALTAIEAEVNCIAGSDAKVLITGESGVGKEVVARLVHERSLRPGPFLSINCAGVPDSLLESELFGHKRGSFTDAYRDRRGWLEAAQGGTIFLDEVAEMSLHMQALLLRFLETGEIQPVGSHGLEMVRNVRVIAATNGNLMSRVEEKTFREDLYYRLNVIRIAIPPLRERTEDILPLVDHFLESSSTAHRVTPPTLSDGAVAVLMAYPWPGNVRELRNVVERLVVYRKGSVVSRADVIAATPSDALAPITAPTMELVRRSTAAALYDRMVKTGESFWTVVYAPFVYHELTRLELRAVVACALEHTGGDFKGLVRVFNMPPPDFKRLMIFLRKYDCVPSQKLQPQVPWSSVGPVTDGPGM
jgi:transcriptional regulator with PAS, ATPase and Fis domain